MDGRQKIALWLGIAVIVAMGAYPPWTITWGPAGGVQTPGGYACLLTSPDNLHKKILEPIGIKLNGASQQISASFGIRLDTEKLLVQWAMAGLVAFGLYVSFRKRD